MLAQLIPKDGGPPIAINRDVTVVGRSREHCDLYINRGSISKMHCVIVKTDGLLFVRDLGSTNGTKVNGQKIVRGALLPGDQLAFANVLFKVFLGPDPEPDETQPIRMPNEAVVEVSDFVDDGSESDVRLLGDDEL
jgi:pSer/pThr/pTyr-binding forkhead associated (FHA) protein